MTLLTIALILSGLNAHADCSGGSEQILATPPTRYDLNKLASAGFCQNGKLTSRGAYIIEQLAKNICGYGSDWDFRAGEFNSPRCMQALPENYGIDRRTTEALGNAKIFEAALRQGAYKVWSCGFVKAYQARFSKAYCASRIL